MKKLIMLSAVLLGTAVASQAGVHVDIGIGLPVPRIPLPGRVIVSHPAPVIVERAPVCSPAPVYVAPRHCEPPRVVYVPRGHYSHSHHGRGHGAGWGNHGGHLGHHGSHSGSHHHGGHRR